MEKLTMEKLVSHCKGTGIVYPGSEIYDGLANTWDYGPVGVELKNNIKRVWWKRFIQESDNSYGVDAGIMMNPKVWEASGHVASFTDPKMDCKICKTRTRADNLVENHSKGSVEADSMSNEELEAYINENKVKCPVCGNFNWTPIRQFHLMFHTSRDITGDADDIIYLRPETAQGEFVNFLNVQRTTRAKLPFGIGQIGKAFRNEITPGNFTFRTIEFEQMEHQLFCKNEEEGFKFYDQYKKDAMEFLLDLGFNKEHLSYKDHEKLAFYAKAACDIIFKYPFGWNELNGIHYRTDYDLSQHQKYSGKNLYYIDPVSNEKILAHDVEYSIGADRLTLAILCEFYDEQTLEGGDTRIVYHFHPAIAPYKVAVLPLQKNLSEKAREVYKKLSKRFMCTFDESGSIGKRYRRQDQIGTPFCVTIDFDTLENGTVTLRDRDTMEQIRLSEDELIRYVEDKLIF